MDRTTEENIEKRIEIEEYYNRGGKVEQLYICESSLISEFWKDKSSFPFDWDNYEYRIQKI